jgi:RNA polymerase sigma-70 factor (ECF subfamily)
MITGAITKNQVESWAKELWPRIYHFFYYRVQNKEEAEELTQETFDRVFRRIKKNSIHEEEKLQAYTFVTARNLVTDLWRKRGRQPGTVSLQEMQDKGWDLPQRQQEVEEKMIIRQALGQLSTEHRRVLTLRIIEGWPVENVARKMQRSPGAVRSLQFRAVRALKEILEKGGYFDE